MLITNFLISSIISHGFLDFLILSKNLNFVFYYIFGFIVYDTFLKINQTFFVLLFILFSGYHFGKDFQIITSNYDGTQIWNGFIIISSTINCKNGFIAWFKFLEFLDIEQENIYIIFHLMKLLFLFSFFSSLILSNYKITFFNISRILIIYNLSVEITILYHMLLIHIPLALYQFNKKFGTISLFFWLYYTIFITFLIEKYGIFLNQNNILMSISITVSHMITISIWQIF